MILRVRLGKVNWRPSGSIHYSRCHYEYLWFMGRVKIPTFTEAWKKLSPALVDDFEVFETSVKKVTADVKIARELGLEMRPEEGTELLKSHGKMLMAEELYLMDEQRILSNSITCMLQRDFSSKSQLMQETSLLSYFKKLPQPPPFSQYQDQGKTL